MAIKSILFNTEMVRAILNGKKSCTRRIVEPRQLVGLLPDKCKNGMSEEFLKEKKFMFKPYCDMTNIELINAAYKAPYQPGDILYVRETWSPVFVRPRRYLYKVECKEAENLPIKLPPSIYMPKEAAHIWLKVTDVRVERLQEMDKMDAVKEGIDTRLCFNLNHALAKFKKMWNSTIKKSDLNRYGWDANPWVWVVEFERCEKPKGVSISKQYNRDVMAEEAKPDWCPLLELPEKNPNNPELEPGIYYTEKWYEVYKRGWNACLDEILK